MGHIGKLVRGDPQLLCQNLTVSLGLVEHIDKVRVLKMFSISREARRSLTFCVKPDGIPPHLRKRFQISTLKLPVCPFKEKVEFVDIEPGCFMFGTVGRNTVPHRILHDQKPDFL